MNNKPTKPVDFIVPNKEKSERVTNIKVIGVGGGGSNAVNYMYNLNAADVDFMVCNTDKQALENSPVPSRLQLGALLTSGLGAGAKPNIGRDAAIESAVDIEESLQDVQMVFITAGMGGGTGTGAAPVIAEICQRLGILTVGIVTVPLKQEGKRRIEQANQGLEELKKYVDTLLIITNDKVFEIYGGLSYKDAFGKANDIVSTAAKCIASIILQNGEINLDFKDVETSMKGSGSAIMGYGEAEGKTRSVDAVRQALESPLLLNNDISGAKFILLNVRSAPDCIAKGEEIKEILDFVQEAANQTAEIFLGISDDPSLGGNIAVTLVATGFHTNERETPPPQITQKIIQNNTPTPPKTQILSNPTSHQVSTPNTNEVANKVPFKSDENPSKPKKEYIVTDKEDAKENSYADYESKELNIKDLTFDNIDSFHKFTVNDWYESIGKILSDPNKLAELESTPAYLRRKKNADFKSVNTLNSSSNSDYNLKFDENNHAYISKQNRGLNGLVD